MSTKLLAGLSILVVEDESLLRKQIVAHLESLGADVAGVGSLQSARQSLGSLNCDFALLDVKWPRAASSGCIFFHAQPDDQAPCATTKVEPIVAAAEVVAPPPEASAAASAAPPRVTSRRETVEPPACV
jgi:CheY-like chemotaxis protein